MATGGMSPVARYKGLFTLKMFEIEAFCAQNAQLPKNECRLSDLEYQMWFLFVS
jgi:hypothetical protein